MGNFLSQYRFEALEVPLYSDDQLPDLEASRSDLKVLTISEESDCVLGALSLDIARYPSLIELRLGVPIGNIQPSRVSVTRKGSVRRSVRRLNFHPGGYPKPIPKVSLCRFRERERENRLELCHQSRRAPAVGQSAHAAPRRHTHAWHSGQTFSPT